MGRLADAWLQKRQGMRAEEDAVPVHQLGNVWRSCGDDDRVYVLRERCLCVRRKNRTFLVLHVRVHGEREGGGERERERYFWLELVVTCIPPST